MLGVDTRQDVGFILVRRLHRVAAVTVGAADVHLFIAVEAHRLLFEVAGVANDAAHAQWVLRGFLLFLLSLRLFLVFSFVADYHRWCRLGFGVRHREAHR